MKGFLLNEIYKQLRVGYFNTGKNKMSLIRSPKYVRDIQHVMFPEL